ncbi:MAG: PepSY-associated TM helix domain-containing protein [Methylovulum miyakonense]|uniref:PepSY domain-containing protein n=1 Tax=Methylovulum miyakonense TaxID=645578 RepID=UPI003BB6E239
MCAIPATALRQDKPSSIGNGPLHSGKAFGWTGRILVFLSGLACPLLFVTGFIRWQQKRRAKQSLGNRF